MVPKVAIFAISFPPDYCMICNILYVNCFQLHYIQVLVRLMDSISFVFQPTYYHREEHLVYDFYRT